MWLRFGLWLAMVFVLSGCQTGASSPPLTAAASERMVLVKPGGSAQQFAVDRYECMQSSQQPTTRTTSSAGGTVASTAQTTNWPLYGACMTTRGYYTRKASDVEMDVGGPEVQAALRAQREQNLRTVCFNPAFSPYFAKTSCSSSAMTPAQLADESKMSPEVKAIFPEVRRALNGSQDAYFKILRQGSPAGAKSADLFVTVYRPRNEQNERDLYNGAITWGAYNHRRQEISRDHSAAAWQPSH